MPLKLHRCASVWLRLPAHPCWRVQRELNRAGIDYKVVRGPLRRNKRDELERLSGQRAYPVIEFENGTVYREGSVEMAARIKSGELSAAGLTSPKAERPASVPE